MNTFEYQRPTTVADAVAALRSATDGKALAGGQSLLPTMKLGLSAPELLVDLSRVDGLNGISVSGNIVRIGAMTSHAAVAASREVGRAIPALARLAGGIGDPGIRQRGTIGGSLATNDPAACYPAALLALDGVVHTDRRKIAAGDFLVGLYQTALEPDELITAVEFPIPSRAGYVKFLQPASRFALVGVFVASGAHGVRVAVTGAAACAFRVEALEKALTTHWSAASCKQLVIPADGLSTDLHASAGYRAHLISVLAARAVEQADSNAA
jgi:carbon-monoxide dehydrogenase medium subunit